MSELKKGIILTGLGKGKIMTKQLHFFHCAQNYRYDLKCCFLARNNFSINSSKKRDGDVKRDGDAKKDGDEKKRDDVTDDGHYTRQKGR